MATCSIAGQFRWARTVVRHDSIVSCCSRGRLREGVGNPRWFELTDHEREMAVPDARNLKAVAGIGSALRQAQPAPAGR
jgi:hypothetical protein